MIPKKILPYLDVTRQNIDSDNTQTEGILTCCNAHDFEIHAVGEIKNSLFSKMYLFPKDHKLALEARCKKCGKVISVFDSSCDGYVCCEENLLHTNIANIAARPIGCRKCGENDFSVGLRYEYPDTQELKNLGIAEVDNGFTWIWVTLDCNRCSAKYRNFIDFEMA